MEKSGPSEQALTRAKTVIIESLNKGQIKPCIGIIKHGFPIDDPIMDCGVNLLMYVAQTCEPEQLSQILELRPNVNVRD